MKIAARTLYHRLRGRRMMSCGSAGVARLRLAARDVGVPLLLETALQEPRDRGRQGGGSQQAERGGKTLAHQGSPSGDPGFGRL